MRQPEGSGTGRRERPGAPSVPSSSAPSPASPSGHDGFFSPVGSRFSRHWLRGHKDDVIL